MYKLIEKIPENIPEDKIEQKILNYKNYECPYKTIIKNNCVISDRRWGYNLSSLLRSFGFGGGCEAWPMSNDPDVQSFSDFYRTNIIYLMPKKWIDGKKEIFIYDNSHDEYFHLIVGEYK